MTFSSCGTGPVASPGGARTWRAVQPASMISGAPVNASPPGPRRKSTAWATSFRLDQPLERVRREDDPPAPLSSGMPCALAWLAIWPSTSGMRADGGAHRGGGDALLGALQRERLDQPEHAVLGRDVAGLERRGHERVRRGDGHEAPAAGLPRSARPARSGASRNGLVADRQQRVPAVLGELGDGRDVLEAGVGARVEAAEGLDGRVDRAAVPLASGEIGRERRARPVGVGLQIDREHVHAGVHEGLRGGAPDAPGGAGDQGDAAGGRAGGVIRHGGRPTSTRPGPRRRRVTAPQHPARPLPATCVDCRRAWAGRSRHRSPGAVTARPRGPRRRRAPRPGRRPRRRSPAPARAEVGAGERGRVRAQAGAVTQPRRALDARPRADHAVRTDRHGAVAADEGAVADERAGPMTTSPRSASTRAPSPSAAPSRMTTPARGPGAASRTTPRPIRTPAPSRTRGRRPARNARSRVAQPSRGGTTASAPTGRIDRRAYPSGHAGEEAAQGLRELLGRLLGHVVAGVDPAGPGVVRQGAARPRPGGRRRAARGRRGPTRSRSIGHATRRRGPAVVLVVLPVDPRARRGSPRDMACTVAGSWIARR